MEDHRAARRTASTRPTPWTAITPSGLRALAEIRKGEGGGGGGGLIWHRRPSRAVHVRGLRKGGAVLDQPISGALFRNIVLYLAVATTSQTDRSAPPRPFHACG